MTVLLAPSQTISEAPLPALDVRALARRAAIPATVCAVALLCVIVGGGRVHAFVDGLRRGLGVKPGWAGLGVAFECVSLAGYVGLLSLVAGRATARIGARESAQITLAGAAATRLLPTAGAGGLGLTLWTLRRAGLRTPAATRTLLAFLVLLYSVFLGAMVAAGGLLTLGLVSSGGPAELSAAAAGAGLLAIALALTLAFLVNADREAVGQHDRAGSRLPRLRAGARLAGEAVRDACGLLRSGDPRLAGALAYWMFDAAVLWAMLHALGLSPAVAVVVLAYFVGQLANTVPVPGSVSGGIAGVLVMFGMPAELVLPSVLAYRAISVWLPAPVAIAAVPGLRATIARWAREDATPAGELPLTPGSARACRYGHM